MPKAPKDLNAPKKPLTAFFLYSNLERERIRADNKELKMTEISKLISGKWRDLDEASRQEFNEKAAKQKALYTSQMKEYIETDEYKAFQKKLAAWKAEQNETQKSKNKKLSSKMSKMLGKKPKAPKKPDSFPRKPASSYFVFLEKRRNELKEENVELALTELSKKIGLEWKALSDEQKKVYQERSEELRKEFDKKMADYKSSSEYTEYMEKVDAFKKEMKSYEKRKKELLNGCEDKMKVRLPRKPTDANAPKKCVSGFFMFSNEEREKVKKEFPDKKMTELSGIIGKKWKELDEDKRKEYEEKSAVDKERYKREMDVYKTSQHFKDYQEKLDAWEEKKKDAMRAAREKMNAKSKKKVVKGKKKVNGKKKKMKYESSSSDSYSSSESSSSGSYSSDSDSSSE